MNRSLRTLLSGGVVALMVLTVVPGSASSAPEPAPRGASPLWQPVSDRSAANRGSSPQVDPDEFVAYTLDRGGMQTRLAQAPSEDSAAAPLVMSLPDPTGGFIDFEVSETAIMEPRLAARHREITTYAGRGVDNPRLTVRLDLTPLGFHASVRGPAGLGSWYIDPYYNRDQSVYVSYFGDDLADSHGTFVESKDNRGEEAVQRVLGGNAPDPQRAGEEVRLRTYRLAFLTDPTYATYFEGNVMAAKVTLMNRVNQIYEDDLAIRMILIDETEKLNLNTAAKMTGPNGPCGSQGCFTEAQATGGCTGGLLNRNRIALGQLVGASSFDIGHIGLGINGGGVAGLGVVGRDGKARGCTGLPFPTGDFYAVDYVAHEMGHQFSGNHTFNGTQVNCGGNKSTPSVEPGSGSSVMAYAGICGQDNLSEHSDPYFSQRSLTEINTYVGSAQSPVDEVQNVSLIGFDTAGDSFRLTYNDSTSTTEFTRGTTYNAANLSAQITALTGRPATVTGFGGSGQPDDTGFQVSFPGSGSNPNPNVAPLGVISVAGEVSAVVGETARGGPATNGGHTVVPTGNHAPVVTSAGNHTIPLRTPFALTGGATDADGDVLTYMWEQNDAGGGTGVPLTSNNKPNGPLFAQFGVQNQVTDEQSLEYNSPGQNHAGTSPTRVFPDMAQILSNNTNAKDGTCPAPPPPPASGGGSNVPYEIITCYAEFLPTGDYIGNGANSAPPSLNFRLTVRDTAPGAGGVGFADSRLTLSKTAGPFLVTAHGTNAPVEGGAEDTITWDVNGTNAAALAPNVRITLSTDGGQTFPTVLAAETPNDGSETVKMNAPATNAARIKIEAVGNVFFDVSDTNFGISNVAPVANPDAATVIGNEPTLIDVLANDTDVNGDALSVTSAEGAQHGTVSVVNNKVRYVRDAGYFGADTFTYTVSDGSLTDTAAVDVTVEPSASPVAEDETVTTYRRMAVKVPLRATDADGDSLTYTVGNADHGKVVVRGDVATYRPEAGFIGQDSFEFRVGDGETSDTGTVTVNVIRRQAVKATMKLSNLPNGDDRIRISTSPTVDTNIKVFKVNAAGKPVLIASLPSGRDGVVAVTESDTLPRRSTAYFGKVAGTKSTRPARTGRDRIR